MKHHHRSFTYFQRAFTLVEVLIILGLIATLSLFIVNLMPKSDTQAIDEALREIPATLRSSFDAALLSGRIHRVALKPKTGEYWTEIAPEGYLRRPKPSNFQENSLWESEKRSLLDQIEYELKNPRRSKDKDNLIFAARKMLVEQAHIFQDVRWEEVSDFVLSRKQLANNVVFVSITTETMNQPLGFTNAKDTDIVYIYFYPSGFTTQASIQLSIAETPEKLLDQAPRFTLVLDPATGQTEIREGLIDVDFRAKK